MTAQRTRKPRPKPRPAFTYSSSSANIDFYRGTHEHMAEVLIDALAMNTETGRWAMRRVPIYRVTVWRRLGRGGVVEAARFNYEPAGKPQGMRLPDRTVTRLVRAKLGV